MSIRRRRGALRPAGLELVALGIALIAVVALVWPVHVTVPTVSRAAPRPPARPVAVEAGDSLREVIVATNLFSGSRRAPRERFRLPGTEPILEVPTAPAPMDAGDTDGGPQLFGIVHVAGSPRALLQITSDGPPRLLGVGDRVGPWRVQRIVADRVELQSSSGTRIVRLSRRSPSDSSGSLP